jgi:hypothetical protein
MGREEGEGRGEGEGEGVRGLRVVERAKQRHSETRAHPHTWRAARE